MALNTVPYEVLVGSGTIWIAPAGTALPAPGEPLTSPWKKVGTDGDLNYDEEAGIELVATEQVEGWTPLGSNSPRKYFRIEEINSVKVTVADMTLEQLAVALNDNDVSTVAATPGVIGYKKIGLEKGQNITSYALITRYNVSPYMANGIMEFRHTIVQQKGQPRLVSKKGEPMVYELEFMTVVDPAQAEGERLGVLIAQNAAEGT